MFDELARQTLQKPLTARVSTIDEQGYPHTVPVWFMLDGDEVIIFSSPGARKVLNAQKNPRGAVTIGGDVYTQPGYMLQGEWVIEPEGDWVEKVTRHYLPDRAEADALLKSWEGSVSVLMRLKPKSVVKVAGS